MAKEICWVQYNKKKSDGKRLYKLICSQCKI